MRLNLSLTDCNIKAILIANLLLHLLKGMLRPYHVNTCDNNQLIASNV
jgi:hypothetical protein